MGDFVFDDASVRFRISLFESRGNDDAGFAPKEISPFSAANAVIRLLAELEIFPDIVLLDKGSKCLLNRILSSLVTRRGRLGKIEGYIPGFCSLI